MRAIALPVAVCLLLAVPAAAQSTGDRGYVTFNAGFQPKTPDLTDTSRFDLYAETATVDMRYPGKEGIVFDGGAGMRLWKRLGAGVSASYRTSESRLTVSGSLPHPFFIDRPRTFDGETSGIARTETGVHLQALYFVPSRGRWRVVLGAGPSYFSAEQELADEARYDDEYPHDEVTFRDPVVRVFSGSKIGFNVGGDVTFLFGRRFGVGGLVRYAAATIDLDGPDNRRIDLDAGGLQAGAGVRILF
jgi:hypothetical protein